MFVYTLSNSTEWMPPPTIRHNTVQQKLNDYINVNKNENDDSLSIFSYTLSWKPKNIFIFVKFSVRVLKVAPQNNVGISSVPFLMLPTVRLHWRCSQASHKLTTNTLAYHYHHTFGIMLLVFIYCKFFILMAAVGD